MSFQKNETIQFDLNTCSPSSRDDESFAIDTSPQEEKINEWLDRQNIFIAHPGQRHKSVLLSANLSEAPILKKRSRNSIVISTFSLQEETEQLDKLGLGK